MLALLASVALMNLAPQALAAATTGQPATPPAAKKDVNRDLKADIFEIGSNRTKLMFKYTRSTVKKGEDEVGTARYFDLDGKEVANEELVLGADGRPKSYTVNQLQSGVIEKFERRGNKAYTELTQDGKTSTGEFDLEDNFVIGPYMLIYLKGKWDQIQRGDSLYVRLGVPSRHETIGFDFQRVKEEVLDGRTIDTIKLSPSSIFIKAFVDPNYIRVDRETFKLYSLIGRTLGKRRDGDRWRDLDGEIVFVP